jgi:hypothetical protein
MNTDSLFTDREVKMKTEHSSACSFLFHDPVKNPFLIPEEFSEDLKILARSVLKFVDEEILPKAEEIEKKNFPLLRSLIRRSAELGFTGVVVPEEYGGASGTETMAMVVTENMAGLGSWVVTFGAHTGIGMLPILYFGTEEQRKKYLPKLVSGEWVGAYALTEPTSGSDALSAKCRADLSEDGRYYILNGTKQFITNAGFADLFVVFAKIGGERFSAFLVERTFPGVSIGPEEKKMGLHGSSTCQLILENARVPRENLLGEEGKGHRIAFNILNIGRFKLGVGTVGGAKRLLKGVVEYASQRKQFGTPILHFPLIQKKLAKMVEEIFLVETSAYRLAGSIDSALEQEGRDLEKTVKVISQFAVESSVLKVSGSEMIQFVIDEGLQILGGYGYIGDYPLERAYRDTRINRIFEGTNEINRLLIPAMLIKEGMKGTIPLFTDIPLDRDLLHQSRENGTFRESHLLSFLKALLVHLLKDLLFAYGESLEKEQEILEGIANMTTELYQVDSAYGRKEKTKEIQKDRYPLMETIVQHRIPTTLRTFSRHLQEICGRGNMFREKYGPVLADLVSLAYLPVDTIEKEREIAQALVEAGGYPFS